MNKKQERLNPIQLSALKEAGYAVTETTTQYEALRLLKSKTERKRTINWKNKKKSLAAQKALGLEPVYNRKMRRKKDFFGPLTNEERQLRKLPLVPEIKGT